jgi:hypothetical protein
MIIIFKLKEKNKRYINVAVVVKVLIQDLISIIIF